MRLLLQESVDLTGITMPLDPSRAIERVLGDQATPLQSAAKVCLCLRPLTTVPCVQRSFRG